MNIGFTGHRQSPSPAQLTALIETLRQLYAQGAHALHHGDCLGMDEVAHREAVKIGYQVVIHPPIQQGGRAFCHLKYPTVEVRPTYEFLQRNQHIIDMSEHLIACPNTTEERLRSGTWATVRYARKKGIPRWLVYPSGEVRSSTSGGETYR